ncbi:MAG TPA: AraC family transcriptional regulator [Sphingobium sp.]|uniref:AraC family transcriptional regulator n=1 Tax=Sphingobium sp. TaxID=1912891 RepID=UPI002ED542FA
MPRSSDSETCAKDAGPNEMFDTVHARMLHLFPELATSLGGDADALLTRAGILAGDQADTPMHPTYTRTGILLELAAQELDCSDFGMRLAQAQGGGLFGPLGIAMRNSRTFGDALDYVRTHSYAHSLASRIQPHRQPEDGSIFVSHEVLLDGIAGRSQLMEQMLLVGHLIAMEMTGGLARARQINFRHQAISSPKTYRRYFGCEVRFGQNQDGCVFPEAAFAAPIVNPDAEAYRAVTAFIDESFTQHSPPLQAQVRGLVMQYLGAEDCSNERIAEELNLHPRTLHRRLKEQGTAFQKIKDEVRRDLMAYYLRQTDLDFAHISERLGFAEQSVFTRSCNRWLAASPSRIRAEGRRPNAMA